MEQFERSDLFKDATWQNINSAAPRLKLIILSSKAATPFFDLLNISVLSGEYVVHPKSCKTLLNQIDEKINAIPTMLDIVTNPVTREMCQSRMESLTTPMRRALKSYRQLLHETELSINHSDVLFSEWSLAKNINENSEFSLLADLFNDHIKVAISDHNLSVDKDQLKGLLVTKKKLENSSISAFYRPIIIYKCDYLIRKINYKFLEDEKNYTYAYEFQDSPIDAASELKYFTSLHEKTKTHYGIDGSKLTKEGWNEVYEKIINKSIETFNDFHTVLQFYKDTAKDQDRIENLKKHFTASCETKLRRSPSDYDREAVFVNQNYFLNCQFSLTISTENIEYSLVLDELNRIRTIQKETGIKNYFPFLKFCEYACKKIQEEIRNFKTYELNEVKYLLDLNNALKDAFKAFEWCKDSKFRAFQLPYSESLIKMTEDQRTLDLFVASSFVLPINYVKVERELKDVEREIHSFKLLSEMHRSIAQEKEDIQKTKDEIQKTDRRSIEIIGIFSAIVLFTSGSIQIFSIEGITVKDGISWMLMFAYCLVLFVFVIWLITRENMALKNLSAIHWFFLAALTGIWVISLMYIFKWVPFS